MAGSVAITHLLERRLEVGWVRRLVRDVLARLRVLEAEAYGVQPLALETEPLRQRRVGAVGEVADARVLEGGHVHPDLVGAAGLELDLEQAGEAMCLERSVVRDAVLPVV